MDAAVLHRLVDEIAPMVRGARVRDVVYPARDVVVFRLDGADVATLGVSLARALPLIFVSEDGGPEDMEPARPPGHRLSDMRGASVVSLEAETGTPTAVLTLERTDQVGREMKHRVLIDLGRPPSLSVRDAGRQEQEGGRPTSGARTPEARVPGRQEQDNGRPTSGARTPEARVPGRPSLGWRHDDAGRLHVGLPPADRPWDETAGFETWNAAALHAATELLPEIVAERRRSELTRLVRRRLRRKKRAVQKVEREIEDSEGAEEYRHKAQLLLMRKDEVPRGEPVVTVPDYDNKTPVEIRIDPALTPARNAEALFSRARKAERRAERAPQRLAELLDRVERLKSILDEIESASEERLRELEDEFRPPRRASGGRGGEERVRFRTYVVSGGWKVLVGKSNRDNDRLTHKLARPDDLWFHVRQAPGSHVVLRRSGRKAEPDRRAIMETAAIAAFHSKARGASKVPVSYTEKRYVRKPRGSRPGLAVMKNENVVFVEPGLPAT